MAILLFLFKELCLLLCAEAALYIWNSSPYFFFREAEDDRLIEKPRLNPAADAALFLPLSFYVFIFREQSPEKLIPCCAMIYVLLLIALSDALFKIIPDQFLFLLFTSGIPAAVRCSASKPLDLALFIILSFLLWLPLSSCFGFGDVKLLWTAAAISGPPKCIFIFCAASLLSGLYSAILLLYSSLKGDKAGGTVAFAPFLCFAAALSLLQ